MAMGPFRADLWNRPWPASLAFMGFLAAAGYAPAIGLLVVFAAGVALIAIGGRVRGTER